MFIKPWVPYHSNWPAEVALLLVEGKGSEKKEQSDSKGPEPTVHGKIRIDEQYDEDAAGDRNSHLLESSAFSAFALEEEQLEEPQNPETEAPPEVESETRKPCRNCALGVLLARRIVWDLLRYREGTVIASHCITFPSGEAVVAGTLAGVQSVPATLYNLEHPEYPSTAVVFPQCVGVWFASTGIYLLYSGYAQVRRKPVQHAVIRPAFVSGCIWSVGFLFMIKGIHELGFAVGYTLDAVGPIIIASIVSICWFKEITGRRQLMIYWTAEALQLLGVILITVFSKQ
ncbi:unnamed protein product [Cladocopium goreaui]|uniref:Transmembrane protein 144 homolog A (Transmembrane protein 144 homolog 1) n=1 Tax=Cladocopium goreaui TaxID=2562237 RepID=A0A9P1FR15_9DINO|nr:unnamed protein product [Cladocopium goreaui]